jgi:hypothetical protein
MRLRLLTQMPAPIVTDTSTIERSGLRDDESKKKLRRLLRLTFVC